MAITRKPTRGVAAHGIVDVEALISKGGSAPSREEGEAQVGVAGNTPIVLRLPTGLLQQVDSLLKARPVKIPRHTWLVEAVYEKIRRESESSAT